MKVLENNTIKYRNHHLLEVSRLALNRRNQGESPQSKKRYEKRLNYQVSNFRGVDLKQLFDNDYFVFTTPIKDYQVTVAFPGVLTTLKKEVERTNGDPGKINLQLVINALAKAFDATNDVKVNCTCADWYYRFSYVATKNGYKYGEPQTIPADVRNPDDDLGSTCKHLDLLLANKRWLRKAAQVINLFINAYPEKAVNYLYDPEDIVYDPRDFEYEDEADYEDYEEIEEEPIEEIEPEESEDEEYAEIPEEDENEPYADIEDEE